MPRGECEEFLPEVRTNLAPRLTAIRPRAALAAFFRALRRVARFPLDPDARPPTRMSPIFQLLPTLSPSIASRDSTKPTRALRVAHEPLDPERWTRRAQRVVRDHELALDVAQDVRIRVWKLGHRSEQECPWIHSALRKHSLFLLRCARRRSFHESAAGKSRLEVDSEHDPERVAMRGELRSAIHTAIAHLPVEFRDACSLRLEHELAYAEIAARLRVPVGTIRSRIARGKQLLQTQLASWIADECLECALRVSGTSTGTAALGSRRPHLEATAAPLQAPPTRSTQRSIK